MPPTRHLLAGLLGLALCATPLRAGTPPSPLRLIPADPETVRIGKEFHAAVAQGALLISNREKALQRGLDLAAGRDRKSMADHPGVAGAARLLPRDALATLWLNMDPVRKTPGGEAVYKTP